MRKLVIDIAKAQINGRKVGIVIEADRNERRIS